MSRLKKTIPPKERIHKKRDANIIVRRAPIPRTPEELFEIWWDKRFSSIPPHIREQVREEEFWDTEISETVSGKKSGTIRRAASEGKIEHTRSGNQIFVLQSSLKEWLRRLFLKYS